jgi:mycothiol synthase
VARPSGLWYRPAAELPHNRLVSSLPDPALRSRPLGPADLEDAFRVIADAELVDAGEVLVERSDIEADWSRPSTDLARDTIGVVDGDHRLLAMAELGRQGTRAEAYVRPEARGRGIGTFLAAWTEQRAAEMGAPRVGQAVPEGSAPHRFLADRGYEVAWTSWVLQLPEGAEIPDRTLPPGYRLVTPTSEQYRATHRVITTAFGEWSSREGETYEEWAPGVVDRPGFEPWMLRVVVHEPGRVVGACFTRVDDQGCGFVHQLAVDRSHRGRGLAQVLLSDGFRGAREHGATRSELTTDSRTGALDLYLAVGMEVTSTWLNLATDPAAAVSR